MKGEIVFDDWMYRHPNSLKQRRIDYFLCAIPLCILTLVSIIGVFFTLYAGLFLLLAIWSDVVVLLEYLKVKNNHLIITKEAIYITNKFNMTNEYLLDYKECSLEIRKSLKRGGGIWLKFYDKNGKFLLKYEDMLNSPTMYGGKLLPWGEAIKSLQIPIVDKNNLYDIW